MEELVRRLVRSGMLRTPRITRAFEHIDRKHFVGEWNLVDAYADKPLPIGLSQTISQPSTVAFMLELLAPERGDCVLDVGSGSCWSTALLAHIVGKSGRVVAVERVEEVLDFGADNIGRYGFLNVEFHQAARRFGYPSGGPYDKILVSAASRTLPQELVAQLKNGGSMVLPVRDAIWRVHKKGPGDVEMEKYEGFAFVPLIRD